MATNGGQLLHNSRMKLHRKTERISMRYDQHMRLPGLACGRRTGNIKIAACLYTEHMKSLGMDVCMHMRHNNGVREWKRALCRHSRLVCSIHCHLTKN